MLSKATAISPVPCEKSMFHNRVFAFWSLQDILWSAYIYMQVIIRVRPDKVPELQQINTSNNTQKMAQNSRKTTTLTVWVRN